MEHQDFQQLIWEFYRESGRGSLPWRNTTDSYEILVSEIMLQQTQADRVIPKFLSFIKEFPTVEALAGAPQDAVLREWKGLGYNRRALNLIRAAKIIAREHGGSVPKDTELLMSLPGIGPYTAAAIRAFAFNEPAVVIETNIRTVFIKHFFSEANRKVHDKELLPLIEETMDRENPREWYSALMDYGSYIKKTEGNFSRLSKSYARQSSFKGSNRENRSHILELLLERPLSGSEILAKVRDERTQSNLEKLAEEGFIVRDEEMYRLEQ